MSEKERARTLVTVKNGALICKHPLNDSLGKAMFSIPKSKRFSEKEFKSSCKTDFYDTNPKFYRSQRATSFGVGKRMRKRRRPSARPAPNKYIIKSCFIKSPVGPTMAHGRHIRPENRPFFVKKNNIPGPGKYTLPSTKSTVAFSLRSRHNPKGVRDNQWRQSVGPGKYGNVFSKNEKGRSIVSRFRNCPGTRFVPNKHSRKVPLKGSWKFYNLEPGINAKGVFRNSKMKNSGAPYFSKAKRFPEARRLKVPGPGSYTHTSDFGIYRSSSVAKHIRL